MRITSVEVKRQLHQLKVPFRTALRTVTATEAVTVRLDTDEGIIGWGEAVPTLEITGESTDSIEWAIKAVLAPAIIGLDLLDYEQVFHRIHQVMVGNTSAKAAVDMACYDCLSQFAGLPLYRYLGGVRTQLETDYTVGIATLEEMAAQAAQLANREFRILKIKAGKGEINDDLTKIKAVHQAAGAGVLLRIDANQGWNVKEAIRAIHMLEDWGIPIEFVEQPVKAHDLEGLKAITDAVSTPIMADESLFSPQDALQLLKLRAVDLFNIKLMKSGGIRHALQIYELAASAGVECMVGSMIESRLSVTAAAHFAASKPGITRVDFDAPLMLSNDPTVGGICYEGRMIQLPTKPGLGAAHPRYIGVQVYAKGDGR
ncbi:mandelate racemase/muconate lactonizing enzyme family protein [Rubeoparvulum massiliense]|uniref:mandelate racemase/muconate lactonizing enzyme family protein n=1 Tax=Rubeoparvulum massiliense TaxID=1631346 RepID=UPI00065E1D74|nr:dipeptide epimerase [Rubeoparvulum massiliense]